MTASAPTPRDHRRRRDSVMRLLGGIVLMLVVVAAASSGDEALWTASETMPTETVEPETPADAVVVPPPASEESGRWLTAAGPVLAVLAVVLAGAAVVIAVLSVGQGIAGWSWMPALPGRRRRRPSSMPLPETPRAVETDEAAVLAAIREGPPRNAIVRCWVLLEQDAAAAGLRRAPSETSSEYVERVIGASSVDPQPIADLGALFREARFSSRPIDETRREQAERSLRRTLASLAGRTEQRS